MNFIRNKSYKDLKLIPIFLFFLVVSTSCWKTDPQDNLFTFKGEMLGQYLASEERADDYSEFAGILQETDVMGLLNTYGEYTCFAPTNEALYRFYEKEGLAGYHEMSEDSLYKLVYNHIIKDYTIESKDFGIGRLSALNMANRYISTNPTIDSIGFPVIYINDYSLVLNRDIDVHNGVIHSVDRVIIPTDSTLVERLSVDKNFSLFFEALLKTNLHSKLNLIEDYSYDPNDDPELAPIKEINILQEIPQFRKYGYTALIESDSTYIANGINDINDLYAKAKEWYPEATDEDFESENNALNQFISYHLINKQLGYTKFILDYDTEHMFKNAGPQYDMYEYIEPMLKNSLIEVKIDRKLSEGNLFNAIPTVQGENGSYTKVIRIVDDNYDNDALNGVYHEIDGILLYDRDVVSTIRSKRLRLDAASFFPEITNNNMRGSGVAQIFILPRGYLENVSYSENTKLRYLSQNLRLEDFQGDEFIFGNNNKSDVLYDLTLNILPIPAGTYEIRLGYQPLVRRGVAQMYWDGKPTGIPVDFTINADDPSIGHQVPGRNSDDPYGYENDKMMRNRGFMKGPMSYHAPDKDWYPAPNARESVRSLRKIVGKYTFDKTERHTLRLKAVELGEFMIDYIEIVPIEVLEKEGVY